MPGYRPCRSPGPCRPLIAAGDNNRDGNGSRVRPCWQERQGCSRLASCQKLCSRDETQQNDELQHIPAHTSHKAHVCLQHQLLLDPSTEGVPSSTPERDGRPTLIPLSRVVENHIQNNLKAPLVALAHKCLELPHDLTAMAAICSCLAVARHGGKEGCCGVAPVVEAVGVVASRDELHVRRDR